MFVGFFSFYSNQPFVRVDLSFEYKRTCWARVIIFCLLRSGFRIFQVFYCFCPQIEVYNFIIFAPLQRKLLSSLFQNHRARLLNGTKWPDGCGYDLKISTCNNELCCHLGPTWPCLPTTVFPDVTNFEWYF